MIVLVPCQADATDRSLQVLEMLPIGSVIPVLTVCVCHGEMRFGAGCMGRSRCGQACCPASHRVIESENLSELVFFLFTAVERVHLYG